MLKAIDWFKVSHAVTFYKTLGYKYVEVPWMVCDEVCRITLPPQFPSLKVHRGDTDSRSLDAYQGSLIGSGEQGLLDMRFQFKPGDMLVTASPCFRPEPNLTPGVTQLQFFKVELMVVGSDVTEIVVTHAERLMKTFTNLLTREKTAEGIDLKLNFLEVGSYGYREHDGFQWTYGTGLAEPRFSTALGI